MGIVDTLKDAVTLIQKADNIELNKTILALQTQVFELIEENRGLRTKITTRDELAFRKNAYWKGEDGPYCSCCWDAESNLVRLHISHGCYPHCPKCRTAAPDPDKPLPKPVRRTARWIRP